MTEWQQQDCMTEWLKDSLAGQVQNSCSCSGLAASLHAPELQ